MLKNNRKLSVECLRNFLKDKKLNRTQDIVKLQELYTKPVFNSGGRGGLMVSPFDFGASAPGSSPGRGHCVVFLGKTFNSHGASLRPGVFNAWGNPAID